MPGHKESWWAEKGAVRKAKERKRKNIAIFGPYKNRTPQKVELISGLKALLLAELYWYNFLR